MKKKNLATAMAAAMAVSAVAPVVAHAAEVETSAQLTEKAKNLKTSAKNEIEASIVNLNALMDAIRGVNDFTNKDKGQATAKAAMNTHIKNPADINVATLEATIGEMNTAINNINNLEESIKELDKDGGQKVADKIAALNIAKITNDIKTAKDTETKADEAKANEAKANEAKANELADAKTATEKAFDEAVKLKEFAEKLDGDKQELNHAYDQISAGSYKKDNITDARDIDALTQPKANIKAVKEAAEKLINASSIDMALVEGKQVTVKEYKDVFSTNGTLATKDDKLSLKEGQEVLYAEGVIGKDLASTTAKYVIVEKIDVKEEMKKAENNGKTEAEVKAAIEEKVNKAKTAYNDFKANLEELKKLTFTKDGKTQKVYDVKISEAKAENDAVVDSALTETGNAQVITLTKNKNVTDAKYAANYTFRLANVKMKDVIVNANDKVAGMKTFKEAVNGTDVDNAVTAENVATLDVSQKANIVTLNKLAYELSKTYNATNVDKKESEKYEAGHINKTITVTEKGTDKVVGKIVLEQYDVFKANKFKGLVNVAEIKDLNSLKLPEISYAKEAVMNALYNGHLSGNEKHELNLKSDITRAEFAKLLVEVRGIAIDVQDAKDFKDVAKGAWYHDYVLTLAKLGIVKGDGDGTFRPEDTITRQEVAVMIAKAMNHNAEVDKYNDKTGEAFETQTIFLDDDAIAAWADASVNALQKAGVTKGYEVKKGHFEFKPENKITRAEALVMINNSLNKNVDAQYVEHN